MTETPRVAVFDLDGTLADTAADLVGALNDLARRERGLARLDAAAERRTAGRGGRALIRRAMTLGGAAADEARVDALFPLYLEAYGARICEESRLFPAAAEALDALEAAGWRLAICTNKPEGLALRLLEALGLGRRFHAVLGADTLAVKKPDPLHLIETVARAGGETRRALMIGDTRTDCDTASAAGVPCVLCRFGYAAEALEELAAAAAIDGFDALPTLAERLVPLRA